MNNTTIERAIEVRRQIPAARERVFAAWVEPETLALWFAPGDLVATVEELDVRPGGSYKITMRGDDGASHTVRGVFLHVEEPQRLQMSWSWEADPEEISQVTVNFLDRVDGTEVLVHHEKLSEESAALHREGWDACLAGLAELSTGWTS